MSKLPLLCLLLLPACVSPEQHDQQFAAKTESRAQLLSTIEADCTESADTAPETKRFLRCVKVKAEKEGYKVVVSWDGFTPVALSPSNAPDIGWGAMEANVPAPHAPIPRVGGL